jgi:hypothetical protein
LCRIAVCDFKRLTLALRRAGMEEDVRQLKATVYWMIDPEA